MADTQIIRRDPVTQTAVLVPYKDVGNSQHAEQVALANVGPVKLMLLRFLDTAGNGTGTKNAVGNYAGAAEEFYIQPPAGTVYRINRMLPSIVDSGSFDSGSYGNGVTLTNGIKIRVEDDGGTIIDLLDGLTIKTNLDWARYCYDFEVSTFGAGNENGHARWTFAKSGTVIRLDGDSNERLVIELEDDFTGLVEHYFQVQGYVE